MNFVDYRFLALRRATQAGTLLLFFAGNAFGWNVLKGNLSAASLFDTVPLADPYHIVQMMAALAVPSSEALVGGLVVAVLYALLFGRAFCGWVCPLNMVTDAANWLRKRTGLDGSLAMSRDARYWIIVVSLAVSFALGVAAFEWVSPISMLHRGVVFGMGFGWMAVLAVFLFDLLVIRNGFCGHVCPLGAFYALLGRFSLIRPGYDRGKCSLCMKCTDICPEPRVLELVGKRSGVVISGECINCGRCIEECPDDAMKFVSRLHSV